MNTPFLRVVVALLALAFVLAACASDSGSTWTFAPTTASGEDAATAEPVEAAEPDEPAEPETPAEPEVTEPAEPAEAPATEAPAEPDEPAEPATAGSGEPRIIELQADSALRFTDAAGEPVPEIAVTPGETVVFRIDNTAGFPHNFYIGQDSELSVPAGTTEAGIADWSTGVEEFEWVVPENPAELKFACTVPGHYYTMQGVFTEADAAAAAGEPAEPEQPAEPVATEAPAEPVATEAPAEPVATEAPAEPVATEAVTEPAAAGTGEPRVIELEADAAIRFMQDGEQIQEIDVTPGETVLFRIDNTAGFPHNFYIGPDEELQVMAGTTDTGIPDWDTGVQEMEWVVPEDVSEIRFACTVPGHYFTMQGDFVVSP